MSLFVFFISLLIAAQHVSGNHVPIIKSYIMLALRLVFCIYLTTNSDLCHLQHKLIGLYNRDEKCLQRGTNWVFK